MRLFRSLAAVAILMIALGAAEAKSIIEILSEDFSTFSSLITKADAVDWFTYEEPLTVFAPTNAAFAKLPLATLDRFEVDIDLVEDMIKNHLVQYDATEIRVEDINAGPGFFLTDNNRRTAFTERGDTIIIDDVSKIVLPDIIANNGVIHGIDTVLMPPFDPKKPPPKPTLIVVELMRKRDDLSMFVNVIELNEYRELRIYDTGISRD